MDINQLDHQLTLAINGSDSVFWDNVVYTVTNTFSWTAVIIMLLYIIFRNNSLRDALIIYLSIALLIFVADRICSGIVKPTVARWRPTQDPELMYLIDTVRDYRGGRFGFFSGHSCNTFCMATFFSLLFRSKKLALTLYLWAATTTFTRLYLGVHYLGDVTVGFFVGITLGTLFYFLMQYVRRRYGSTTRLISEQFTSSGFVRDELNALLSLIAINYVLVFIVAMTLSY